jgi:hypothetical protein
MRNLNVSAPLKAALLIATCSVLLAACATTPPPCVSPQTRNLNHAILDVQSNLRDGGCAAHFDRYYDELLTIAEGDPKAENKRVFSEFLVWSSDAGLLSQRQARDYYNRYFNVKFTSMQGDYNNCSHTCPRRDRVMRNMERELSDKERGLMKISLDGDGYYRADKLYQEVELVLEATCTACDAAR